MIKQANNIMQAIIFNSWYENILCLSFNWWVHSTLVFRIVNTFFLNIF